MRLLLAVAGGALPAVAAWSLGRLVTRRLRLPPVLELAAGAALVPDTGDCPIDQQHREVAGLAAGQAKRARHRLWR